MKLRRITAIVATIVMLFTALCLPAYAASAEDPAAEPRYRYIDTARIVFNIASDGTMSFAAIATGQPMVDKIRVRCILQCYENGKWVDIDDGYISEAKGTYVDLSMTYPFKAVKNVQYRVKNQVRAYNALLFETIDVFSLVKVWNG